MPLSNPFKLIISLVLPFIAGFIGALATMPALPQWYASLTKPALNPPDWIFAPIWSILYLMMGFALYLIWRQLSNPSIATWQKPAIRQSISIFLLHLVINSAWSIVFFSAQSPFTALFVITFLLLLIIILIIKFYLIDKAAAFLLLPYFLWTCFATYLNYSIWQLN